MLRTTSNLFTATASASDCACRGSKRSPRSDAPEPRKIFRRESAALRRGDGSGGRQGIVVDAPRLPQLWPRPPTQNAPQAPGECCHTMPALPANPHSPLVSRRPEVSRFLKQARPDLLPRDDVGRVFLMPTDSVIKLRPLRIRQRYRVRFQALPDRIQQFRLLRSGQAIDLASQIVHTLPTLTRFVRSGKSRRSAGVSEAGARSRDPERSEGPLVKALFPHEQKPPSFDRHDTRGKRRCRNDINDGDPGQPLKVLQICDR